ncbi:hypothetical protein SAMN05880574_12036 [Chryseobacterium sp. RU37D]|uniref:hypothetical protein n=1 Tax=Chryseobacterium sp. RU37D TaxID=1907397 RepID=UPI000955F6E2|nr:hypothetical protein [Chryseobacterium sp. RU37D]SIQ67538.1 hypothetical protein SAMN05880574_12036 [Chryseobacterium sp. RU37D]
MKRLFYFILLLVGISTIHSCKDLLDEDGNPLNDINSNTGLNGPRALYREITDTDTLAEYHYNGLQLTKVITPGFDDGKKSITDIMYSGDKVSKVTFNGHLDLDSDGNIDIDSVSYTQFFAYGPTGRLESISENRQTFIINVGPPPSFTLRKTKTLYILKYAASTSKLDSIIMRTGEDVTGTSFEYKNYSRTKYTYSGDNVSTVTRHYGPMSGGVFAPAVSKYSYGYSNYDAKINPFTLIPFAYKISRILSTEINDSYSWILSPNCPKRVSVTDLTQPVPVPVVFSTDYNYDPQTYMVKGFDINYIYKPL